MWYNYNKMPKKLLFMPSRMEGAAQHLRFQLFIYVLNLFFQHVHPNSWNLFFSSIKVARRPWAPRTVLEFAIKTHFVLDSWKTFCCPWIFSRVLENSWIFLKFFIKELLITLNIQESRTNNVNEHNNVRFVYFSISYMVNIAWLAHTWFKLSESSPLYTVPSGVQRGEANGATAPGIQSKVGIQRVKLQILKCCSKMISLIVRLVTHALIRLYWR